MQGLNRAMPVVLDTSGVILLSGSAILFFGVAAGVAALGVGCLVLNWRFYGT
jgi:hypothetical protein